MSVFSMAGSNPALPTYPLQRSVRLRSSASAYFNRTLTTPTNGKIWTWSAWTKLGAIGTREVLFCGASGTNVNYISIDNFTAANANFGLTYANAGTTVNVASANLLRDPSAWYHLMVVYDSTSATATITGSSTDRVRLYINGVQVTSFSATTAPALNATLYLNAANSHALGRREGINDQYFDGYLEEINFIDGQALTPSSFGAYNSYGVWSPIKYTGSYGTNGFYLSFQDNSSVTTTANVGIGADSSGNGNYWTSNNISLTAGVTYDSMVDVPTNTSPTNANFAVLNPLDTGSSATVANGNLSLTYNTTAWRLSRGTFGVSVGKWYWEASFTAGGTANANELGVVQAGASLTNFVGSSLGYAYGQSGAKIGNGTTTAGWGASYTTNDIIGVALDMDAGTIAFYKNGVSQGTAFTGITGEYFPAFDAYNNSAWVVNFGQRPFSYTPPTGFNRLNTYNLPDSIVPVGAQYMAATTYTGTGVARSVSNTVNGTSMQPDLVWVKGRSGATDHALYDSVRGTTKQLESNTTTAETTEATGLTAFGSSGFTVGALAQMNTNAATYVGWQWRASNASAVTNTAGTITSQVSANQTAGFSIVTFTGTGVNKATVGHGLGVFPAMIILKNRSAAVSLYDEWWVWTVNNPVNRVLKLNQTDALISTTAVIAPASTPNTSTTFTIGGDTGDDVNLSNKSGSNYVAYCFAAVPGYSKVGSYTGNGSTDGPFVYLGFRPRFVLFKTITDGTTSWLMMDSSRSVYNLQGANLFPNLSNAEGTIGAVDFLSNGFKPRINDLTVNGSGGTYIYAAFAENPFKNSLAR